jgi:hypothetical protein
VGHFKSDRSRKAREERPVAGGAAVHDSLSQAGTIAARDRTSRDQAGVAGGAFVADEPEDDTAHPAEQSVAGTGVARDAIASRLSAGMPIVIGVAPPPNVVEDAPRV